MEKETQRRHRRYPPTREDSWKLSDIVTFLVAVVFALMLGVNAMAGMVRSLQAEAAADASAAKEEEPYYMTFVRGVWHALDGGGGDGEQDDGQETPATQVDISIYANDSGDAGKLYQMKEEYPQVYTILSHYDEIPARLISLAVNNTETMDFVAQYPELAGTSQEIDLSDEARSAAVPLFMQWDTRWGYDTYGDGMIAYTGCGPTCLSMVAVYLTKDASLDPGTVAAWADQAGYYVLGSGTAWSLMSTGCEHFGLAAEELSLDESVIAERITAGQPVICSVGPGDFTDGGHYIVLTGYEDGAFTVNDPNSVVRSQQTWTYDRLAGQIKDLWAYTLK